MRVFRDEKLAQTIRMGVVVALAATTGSLPAAQARDLSFD